MASSAASVTHRELKIPIHALDGRVVELAGTLALPQRPRGLVLFAHGSGSSRHSPRNRFVAEMLNAERLGTVLFDLLTEHEAADRLNVFDVELLADRLLTAVHVMLRSAETADLPIGLFGASTGAAAALVASARERHVKAVVSRGGRPDLAGPFLARVEAATLFIVGGEDRDVLERNREAYEVLVCEKHLAVIPRATHLFEESGTLEEAAHLAVEWFARCLQPASELTGA